MFNRIKNYKFSHRFKKNVALIIICMTVLIPSVTASYCCSDEQLKEGNDTK